MYKRKITFFASFFLFLTLSVKLKLNLIHIKNRSSAFFCGTFSFTPHNFKHYPLHDGEKIHILFPTRMLWDKGVKELREASQLLKAKYKGKVKFILCGLADMENKAGVSEDYLRDWEEEDFIEWVGYQKDMVRVFKNSDIVVLPSYREGMPKSLIEACAIGRPIVTTEAIGCKECVDEGVNGFKVPVKAVEELANALEKLILDKSLRVQMGNNSRAKAEREFNQKDVILKHLEIYQSLYDA